MASHPHSNPNRREFLKESLLCSSGLALTGGAIAKAADAAPTAAALSAVQEMPQGAIGKMKVSRLLLGGNLLTHFTHSRDLRYVYRLAAQYNTREKIFETMAVAEANGVNTLVIHTADGVLEMLKEYRTKRGGKMQWIICSTVPLVPGLADYKRHVAKMVNEGVDAIYVWGVQSDAVIQQNRVDLLGEAVEVTRSLGVPSGVGAHLLDVLVACEQNKVKPDFFIKTFHHLNYPSAKLNYDSSWCIDPEAVARFMKNVEAPWIAFKTMAAGAIPARDAFSYALQNGADFVLAGMFDFEIAEDAKILKEVLSQTKNRERPWRA